MEWWILAGLALAVVGVAVTARRRKPRRNPEKETKNIYPLW